jgi:hypothetical protein
LDFKQVSTLPYKYPAFICWADLRRLRQGILKDLSDTAYAPDGPVRFFPTGIESDKENSGRKMEKKQAAIENPVTISGMKITALTEFSIYSWAEKSDIFFFGRKKPLYVFVSGPEFAKAFSVTGEAVSFESIALNFPELKEALEKVLAGNT